MSHNYKFKNLFDRYLIQLKNAGVQSPRADLQILFSFFLKISVGDVRKKIILDDKINFDDSSFQKLINLRISGIPVQIITRSVNFFGYDLFIKEGVFIPRPETEMLVEKCLAYFDFLYSDAMDIDYDFVGTLNILDLCTGSGAILISLINEFNQRLIDCFGVGVDINPTAIALAKKNSANIKEQIDLIHADATIFQAEKKFNIITCNPPYVPDYAKLNGSAEFDPKIALYGGGEDGTEVPKKIIENAVNFCLPGTFFVMEHFETQADEIAKHFLKCGFEEVSMITDLNNQPRFTCGVYNG
ncbi:MAG: peptide chain release factor N(5)-glutamine methyltransferase [Candidatus Ancillula sp.]|nr:peptide chain release factor N(5)-glutamine methyltransferase [Candidatus Ancillula sp.]